MDARFLKLLGSHAALYPARLQAHAPEVVDVIALLWGHPELYQYLDKLLLGGHSRQTPLSSGALREIHALRALHERLHPRLHEHRQDAWGFGFSR